SDLTGLGEPLRYRQEDIGFEGVSLEYRLIAEDPENNFTPWVGQIENFSWDDAPWLTMLTHVPDKLPYEIPTEFDPNLALAIIYGKDIQEARKRGTAFLNSLRLTGKDRAGASLKSNAAFLKDNTGRILYF
ncbi:MAG: acetyl-CoA carboxylase biotin carboxylase subunit, partial [Desulfovibrio sp.]|nr:acetyl-CoA carboxylase biotin carboxylase subunit [Desulfovibrio sp.]